MTYGPLLARSGGRRTLKNRHGAAHSGGGPALHAGGAWPCRLKPGVSATAVCSLSASSAGTDSRVL